MGRSGRGGGGHDPTPFSCFLFRPRKRLEKRRKRSYTNVSNASVIRTSSPPAQTPHVRFHGQKWVHARLCSKDRTQAFTGRNMGHFGWGWYHYPRTVSHVSETLRGRGLERQTLPLLGLGWMCSPKTQKACGTAKRLCASLFRRRRGPAGLRDLFRFCRSCGLYTLRSVLSECARRGVVSLPSVCSVCC